MSFLLDSDTVSFALRGEGHVVEAIRARMSSEMAVSPIAFGYCLEKHRSPRKLVEALPAPLQILAFDGADAARYGQVAARLAERGEPIGVVDGMLAAHAVARGLTLVTHNQAHFRRVRGLHLDDWYGQP